MCFFGDGGKNVLPFFRHVDNPVINDLGSCESGVKRLESAKADAIHPLNVFECTVFGDVSVHPMPPYAGLCLGRRIHESFLQFGGSLTGRSARVAATGNGEHHRGRNGQQTEFLHNM